MRFMVCFFVFLFCAVTSASAAHFSAVNSKDAKTRIDLTGEIVPGDTDKLIDLVRAANEARRVVVTIRLNSPGGNLVEGVKLSDLVKKAHIATAVRSDATCASACFIIFSAGDQKFAHYQARIGVHGASDASGRETVESSAATISMARIVKDLGVPSGIVGKMVVTPPEQMVWLTVDDLRSMGTTMFGKPSQIPTTQPQTSQLPLNLQPSVQASTASSRPTWAEFLSRATRVSAAQNNGKPRYIRTCQPEVRTCITSIWYRTKENKQVFLKATETADGKVFSHESCELNDFGDVRDCIDWDRYTVHRDMKNAKGEWYKISGQ